MPRSMQSLVGNNLIKGTTGLFQGSVSYKEIFYGEENTTCGPRRRDKEEDNLILRATLKLNEGSWDLGWELTAAPLGLQTRRSSLEP